MRHTQLQRWHLAGGDGEPQDRAVLNTRGQSTHFAHPRNRRVVRAKRDQLGMADGSDLDDVMMLHVEDRGPDHRSIRHVIVGTVMTGTFQPFAAQPGKSAERWPTDP